MTIHKPSATKKKQKAIRILIAEDRYICQQIWQSYLAPETDLEVIGTAIDGQAAIELAEQLKPNVILMDINMPRMDGLTATEIIANRYIDIKILILSISDDVEYIKKSLKIGAKGYLLKNTSPHELVTAIRNINRGYCQLGSGLMEKLDSDTLPVLNQQFNLTHHSFNLVNQSEPRVFNTPTTKQTSTSLTQEETLLSQQNLTEENSVDVLSKWKSKTSSYLNLRLFILLLFSSLAFLFTPPGRKWISKLSNTQLNKEAIAQNSDSTTILPVETIKVNLINSYKVARTYTGTIIPRRSSSLGFQRPGKLINLTADRGDRVQVGTSIAQLDTRNLIAQQQKLLAERKQANALLQKLQAGSRSETITAAQSTIESLQSQLNLAQIKSQRRQELYTSGAISREQLDEANTQVNTFQARLNESQSKLDELLAGTRSEEIEAQQALLEQSDAKLASLNLELEQSTLTAPFTGTIGNRLVDEGTVVSSGESIFTLVEAQNLEVHVGVPVDTATQILLDSNQQIQIGSKIYQAKVLSILPQLDSATRTLTVVMSLEQPVASKIRAGQIARLRLSENIVDSGYWLPTTALVKGVRGLWSCYVLGELENIASESKQTFRVEKRELEVLQTESDRVFVRGTLQNSDRVIVNGNHRIVIGQLVRSVDISKIDNSY